MNLQCEPILEPLKVIIVNPLGPAAQLVIVKVLSGAVFGENQMIDLILLVYANEVISAEELKLDVESCAFSCNNSVEITSDLPSILDGDVFCFITNFANPNSFGNSPQELADHFEDLYLIIKIANNFVLTNNQMGDALNGNYKNMKEVNNKSARNKKPIIITDGLIALDILKSLSTNLPTDILYCPTPLTTIAKSILGEYLNVACNDINDVLVWAANDNAFHVEVEKPLIIHDAENDGSQCDWGMISKDLLDSLNLDHTQFSSSWLKKEFISKVHGAYLKVATSALKNPYGCIYKASGMARTLRDIWLARSGKDGMKVYRNIGVISDGSIGTLKDRIGSRMPYQAELCNPGITLFLLDTVLRGIKRKRYPYVLPLILDDNGYTVSKRFENSSHLKQEMKKINEEVLRGHQLLMQSCKRILFDNIINEVSSLSESGSMDRCIE